MHIQISFSLFFPVCDWALASVLFCILSFDSFHCFLFWPVPSDLAHYVLLAGLLLNWYFRFCLLFPFVSHPAKYASTKEVSR